MAAGDLTSLSAVKQFLTVKGDGDDFVLTSLITAVSSFISNYLNNPILSASYVKFFNGVRGQVLVLPNWPITALTFVKIDGVSIPIVSDAASNGAVFDEMAIRLRGYVFTQGVMNVQVSWTSGYQSAPAEVAQVCNELVGTIFRSRAHLGEKSKSAPPGGTITFADMELTPLQKEMLKNYNRKALI